MRTFVIILVVMGVAFLGLVAYGGKRDEPLPDVESIDADGQYDRIAAFALSNAPAIEFDPAQVMIAANAIEQRPVGAVDDEEPRIARVRLVSGGLVMLRAEHEDEDDDEACVCQPGLAVTLPPPLPPPGPNFSCPSEWLAKQQPVCSESGAQIVLPFYKDGGRLLLRATTPAEVAL